MEDQTKTIKLKYGMEKISVYLDWSLKNKLIINVWNENDDKYLFSKELRVR